jgi:hypothetical protein
MPQGTITTSKYVGMFVIKIHCVTSSLNKYLGECLQGHINHATNFVNLECKSGRIFVLISSSQSKEHH